MTYWLMTILAPASSLTMAWDSPAQQQDIARRIPLWVWLVGGLIVIIIGVIWTLQEEDKLGKRQPQPATSPEPVRTVEPPPAARKAVVAAPSVPVAEPEPAPVEAAPPAKPDDLKRIKGIGPKIAQILNSHGIFTFEQLAESDVAYLERLMDEQDWHMTDTATWPAQARELAAQKKK